MIPVSGTSLLYNGSDAVIPAGQATINVTAQPTNGPCTGNSVVKNLLLSYVALGAGS